MPTPHVLRCCSCLQFLWLSIVRLELSGTSPGGACTPLCICAGDIPTKGVRRVTEYLLAWNSFPLGLRRLSNFPAQWHNPIVIRQFVQSTQRPNKCDIFARTQTFVAWPCLFCAELACAHPPQGERRDTATIRLELRPGCHNCA